MEKVTVTDSKIQTFETKENADVIRFDNLEWNDFYLYGKKVAEIRADFAFTAPGSRRKKYSFVSVTFTPDGKRYDYLSEIPLQPGDKAIVETSNGEKEVAVVAAFEKEESELAFPVKRYKKIVRKAE